MQSERHSIVCQLSYMPSQSSHTHNAAHHLRGAHRALIASLPIAHNA